MSAKAGEIEPGTYTTGFCGVGNHDSCPVVIEHRGKTWPCHCSCHEARTYLAADIEDVTLSSWEAVWGQRLSATDRLVAALRKLLVTMRPM